MQTCNARALFGQSEFIIYGLETVVSVLFTNTRTRLPYNERTILHEAKLSAGLKISSSLYGEQVRVFVNKTRTNSLQPF